MRFDLDQTNDTLNVIQAYEAGQLKINNQCYQKSCIVSPNLVIPSWEPLALTEFKEEHWQPILDLKPEIIILGLGEQQYFLAPSLLKPVYEGNIGIEMMTYKAACYTYNVLVSEGRHVVAGFILST